LARCRATDLDWRFASFAVDPIPTPSQGLTTIFYCVRWLVR
jgi:hypothetical protein